MCRGRRPCSREFVSSHQVTIFWSRTARRKYDNTGICNSLSLPTRLSLDDAEKELSNLLAEAVELHMIADVPVGVLLSGGVDSTAVLSFAAEKTDKEISSYTVGFSDSGVADERPYAKLAAETFGTQHHDMTITAGDFAEFLPRYVWHMEEPVCEPPAVAMYYVSKLAKNYVKVLLSGEGGDEAFAGYSNYRNILWLERLKHSASAQRRGIAGTLRSQFMVPLVTTCQVLTFDECDVS